MSTLISLLILVLILGLIYWVITLIPLPPPFKTVALVVFAIIAILYLVSMLGALPGLDLPRLR
ncbi:MAG: hypothetical protein AB7G13_28795 [Lautropia sp.]